MITITKKFEFESAHHLPGYEGPCQYMHGHTFKLSVTVTGDIDPETGMVIDFSILKAIVNNRIIDRLDHKILNEILHLPTSENLVSWMVDQLLPVLDIVKIRLHETSNSDAEWIK